MIKTISVNDDLLVLIINYSLSLKRSMSNQLIRAFSIYLSLLILFSYLLYYLIQSKYNDYFIFVVSFFLFVFFLSGIMFISLNIFEETEKNDLINWKADFYILKRMINLLEKSFCEIQTSNSDNYIVFFIPVENMIYDSTPVRDTLLKIIKKIRPDLNNEGWQLYLYPIYPLTPTSRDQSSQISLTEDLEKIIKEDIFKTGDMLSEDIKQKGIEMSEVYIYLYCIENSLRVFIDNFYTKKYEKLYEGNIEISNSVKQKIQMRKEEEQKNKWVGIRGDSFVYYLDFKELGDIIINNKDILQYFPDELFVKHTINTLTKIRNLTAHNSYVGQHEKDILRVNYHMLLQQIKGT